MFNAGIRCNLFIINGVKCGRGLVQRMLQYIKQFILYFY